MAGVATEGREEPFAVLCQRHSAGRAGEPLLVVVGTEDDDVANHRGVIGTAILSAEEVVGSGCGGLEPDRSIAARNGFALHAKCGDRKAVKHVLRNQSQLNGAAGGHV